KGEEYELGSEQRSVVERCVARVCMGKNVEMDHNKDRTYDLGNKTRKSGPSGYHRALYLLRAAYYTYEDLDPWLESWNLGTWRYEIGIGRPRAMQSEQG
ncbi:hypothetical protein Ancab_016823, partial [Ancistrocladus abbreviatus]